MTNILKRLNEIEARAKDATGGPWFTTESNEVCRGDTFSVPEVYSVVSAQTSEDSEFIASARTDIPALVAALKVAIGGLDYAADEYNDHAHMKAMEAQKTLEQISQILR